ncbi:MAG: hypothetical protein LBL35_08540 [Clostridiales bacterium]|jgi:dTMP kinase|nr:hypothetical protein [Clostridiales bacterium]
MRRIIAFEGIDGAGKTVQVNALKTRLEASGRSCVVMEFPRYDSFFGKEIGKALSGKSEVRADDVDAKSMALWYAMDRWSAFEDAAGAAGETPTETDFLLLNRYVLSNAAYQGVRSEDPLFYKWVFALEHQTLGLPRPDVYFVLDAGADISRKNVAAKGFRSYVGDEADVYERMGRFLENAREAYLNFAKILDNVMVIDCAEGGEMLAPDIISLRIWEALEGLAIFG